MNTLLGLLHSPVPTLFEQGNWSIQHFGTYLATTRRIMDRSQSMFGDRVIYTSTLGSPIEDAFYVKLYQFQLLRGVPVIPTNPLGVLLQGPK